MAKKMSKAKYVWSDISFDEWVKQQKKNAEKVGINTSTTKITKRLMNTVILPNNVNLFEIEKRKIRIKINIK